MLEPFRTGPFKRDVKRAEKRGKDLEKLGVVIRLLVEEAPLPARYRNHPLKGVWSGFYDLHIEPDWILIYQIDGNELVLARTGTHSDLFDE